MEIVCYEHEHGVPLGLSAQIRVYLQGERLPHIYIYTYIHIYLRYTSVEPGGVILPMPLKKELAVDGGIFFATRSASILTGSAED